MELRRERVVDVAVLVGQRSAEGRGGIGENKVMVAEGEGGWRRRVKM